jgi:protein-tyrosine phosphatase
LIDLHSHILPGIDDGARTMSESIELAREAAAAGVTAIAATPHVREDYPTAPEEMEQAVAAVQAEVSRAGIQIRILRGGEVAAERLSQFESAEIARFGLGGNPGYLLVEMPDYGWPAGIERRILRLAEAGITPVLAHPERNPDVQANIDRVGSLVRSGALAQLTVASLTGGAGPVARATALALLEAECAHIAATDLHGPHVRRAGLDALPGAVGDPELVEWLTKRVPAAIVSGTAIPPRPAPTERPRRFWQRARRADFGS